MQTPPSTITVQRQQARDKYRREVEEYGRRREEYARLREEIRSLPIDNDARQYVLARTDRYCGAAIESLSDAIKAAQASADQITATLAAAGSTEVQP